MFYRMHDAEPAGMIPTRPEDRAKFNAQGFGIFHTVNEFGSARRIEHLKNIRAWAVDIDDGSKDDQLRRIERSPLIPSTVVESKRGFHVYWRAKAATVKFFKIIVRRIVEFLRGDKNAMDLARVLRTPGFWHQKSPSEPFLVQVVHRHPVAYTERQMLEAFPPSAEEFKEQKPKPEYKPQPTQSSDDIFERIYNLDQRVLLQQLSGHYIVSGDQFEFKRNRNGNHNIVVNGKGTGCWIDENGRIGSADKGGPTVIQWIKWYGRSTKEALDVVKEIASEVVCD